MAGLIPFDKRNADLYNTGYDAFQNVLDDFFADGWPPKRSLAGDTFKVDVQENEKDYVVEAELPGVDKKELNISLEDGRLKILVAKEESSEEKNKNYIHKERRYSSMCRSIFLSDSDSKDIIGKLENGVLVITVPKKRKQDKSVKIEIE